MKSELAANAAGVRKGRLQLILILGCLSAFGPFSLDMYLPALPHLAHELQTGAAQAQLSLTFCLLGLSLGQIVIGPISDVRGRRGLLLAGLSVYALASILCAWSSNVWLFILLRFIQGISGAAGIVLSRAAVRDLYAGSEMTRFFSMLMLVNGAAPILAPIAGGQLLQFTSWRGIFIVLGLLGVAMLLSVLWGLPETLPPVRRSTGGIKLTFLTFKKLLSDREFVGYTLAQGLVTAAMFAYISGSPFVLQELFGVTPQQFSLIFATNGLGIIIAGQATGRLVARYDEGRLFVMGLALSLIGGVVLITAIVCKGGLFVILPALFIVVSSVGIVSTSGTSLALQKYGQAAGSASALIGLLSYIFGSLVSPLVGLGGSQTALPMGVVIVTVEVGAVLCYLLLVYKKKTTH